MYCDVYFPFSIIVSVCSSGTDFSLVKETMILLGCLRSTVLTLNILQMCNPHILPYLANAASWSAGNTIETRPPSFRCPDANVRTSLNDSPHVDSPVVPVCRAVVLRASGLVNDAS